MLPETLICILLYSKLGTVHLTQNYPLPMEIAALDNYKAVLETVKKISKLQFAWPPVYIVYTRENKSGEETTSEGVIHVQCIE